MTALSHHSFDPIEQPGRGGATATTEADPHA
ncbi:type II toxin-antitoxin system PemK/MazF family toxin, partial [Streptomyces sp. SID7760]|nr:type II toxin-antitoxin system PemK/MazF family toxin [Streptomyces sp. SID7760]